MKDGNAIEVNNITKSFKIYTDRGFTMKELFLFSKRRAYEKRTVLNGISFEVKRGEAIGLIGHNGCGKSTTLKLLTRIMYPDSGTIEMKGRVSSLIELGAGFHPDLSGRENIYINASIFGLNKNEIDARLNDIIRFSELEEFIDTPVRTYSSGMYMRLAFAVAINVDADILLIDEILAVGDAGFQTKCFNKLKEIKAAGTTIVIVSHSLGQIEEICERSYWIHEGKIVAEGSPREVHPLYLDYMANERVDQAKKDVEAEKKKQEEAETASDTAAVSSENEKKEDERGGNGRVRVTSVELVDENGETNKLFRTDKPVAIRINYHVNEPIDDADIGVAIYRTDGLKCYSTSIKKDKQLPVRLDKDGSISLRLDTLLLLPSHYTVDVSIDSEKYAAVDYYEKAAEFDTVSRLGDSGVIRIPHSWDC